MSNKCDMLSWSALCFAPLSPAEAEECRNRSLITAFTECCWMLKYRSIIFCFRPSGSEWSFDQELPYSFTCQSKDHPKQKDASLSPQLQYLLLFSTGNGHLQLEHLYFCLFYYLFLSLTIGNHEQKTMQGSKNTAESNMSSHVIFWKILYLIKIKHKNGLKDCSEPPVPPDWMQIGRKESGIL